MVGRFSLSRLPEIHFGSGQIVRLPELAMKYGKRILLVTGGSSFRNTEAYHHLMSQFKLGKIASLHAIIDREPSPQLVDGIVDAIRNEEISLVIAIGGGSVMDAGKAISAMLTEEGSVKDYLEGVGYRQASGSKIPFFAVPTTSGTGSEATKNAVLSEIGPGGYKKSLRHDHFVPDLALVDPELSVSCPPALTAYSGMDAFTQLLEAYVSTKANPLTDSLCVKALNLLSGSLLAAYQDGEDIQAREAMSYAALISGMVLAQVGLGVVHGFASAVGGMFDMPHGIICGRLMGPANSVTLEKLDESVESELLIQKYATVGRFFSDESGRSDQYYADKLMGEISFLTEEMKLPRLGAYGVSESHFDAILSKPLLKYHPYPLDLEMLHEILKRAI